MTDTPAKRLTPLVLSLLLASCAPPVDHGDGAAPASEPTTTPAIDPAPSTEPGSAGDGDSQGDALVAGTSYHATAQVRCAGYQGAAEGLCDAGVVRGLETGPYVEVDLPDGRKRTIFFNPDGRFLSFSTAEADGTAALAIGSSRQGDITIATLGTERYEIPDAFVLGD